MNDWVDVDEVQARAHAGLLARRWLAEGCVFLDTETTGLGERDEVCDLAIVDASGVVLLNTLVRPRVEIPRGATRLHGITNEMVSAAGVPRFVDVLDQLAAITHEWPCVIYNADFDARLIVQSVPVGRGNLTLMTHCAMELFAEWAGVWDDYREQWKWHRLADAAAMCGGAVVQDGLRLHRALADAETCRRIVKHIATEV